MKLLLSSLSTCQYNYASMIVLMLCFLDTLVLGIGVRVLRSCYSTSGGFESLTSKKAHNNNYDDTIDNNYNNNNNDKNNDNNNDNRNKNKDENDCDNN